jgi:hypothetical protein
MHRAKQKKSLSFCGLMDDPFSFFLPPFFRAFYFLLSNFILDNFPSW